jgi:hypothetical protein
LRRKLRAIAHNHNNLFCITCYMVIGYHIPVFGNDKPGTKRLDGLLDDTVTIDFRKIAAKKRIVSKGRTLNIFFYLGYRPYWA